jgi:hypothetical protein
MKPKTEQEQKQEKIELLIYLRKAEQEQENKIEKTKKLLLFWKSCYVTSED